MSGLEFSEDTADAARIRAHLEACDANFVPRLSDRIDLTDYAAKLAAKARRFEAWDRGELVGLVAAYCNEGNRQRAFVTNVSVLPQAQGRGIASQLIGRCISEARGAGFGRLELEVGTANSRALALYARHGFYQISEGGGTAAMTIELNGTKR